MENTFYLKDQFSEFLANKNFNLDVKIIEDGEYILDTGGGIQNMIQDCQYDILRVATNWKTETNNGTRVVSEQTTQILNNLCVDRCGPHGT